MSWQAPPRRAFKKSRDEEMCPMCPSKMELKLQLCVLMLFINGSVAVKHLVVIKGETVELRCPITRPSEDSHVEWKNPDGNIMFFNMIQGVRDKRYSLHKLSESEFSVKISNVTFKDGGRYTCSQYLHHTHTVDKTVELTVLGLPQLQYTTHEGKTNIKCTAEANHSPPKISWIIRGKEEFNFHSQIIHEGNRMETISRMSIKFAGRVVTVKCIARHPLYPESLMEFVTITPDRMKKTHTLTPSLPGTTPSLREQITGQFTTMTPEKESVTHSSTGDALSITFTSNSSHFNTSDFDNETATTVFPSGTVQLDTSGWTTTDVSFNQTQKNHTENEWERHEANGGNTSLLVFLVTCLIVGLLVVVIFIGIKLRKAHIAWKRENDDSDTSEASSKSKSSQEEKNAQRRRGFTQYVVQEPTSITSVTNPAAMTSTEDTAQEQPSPAQPPAQTAAKSNIKETEL